MAKPEKNKKDNKHFFKDFKAELKKVIWPTPKQLANNTVAVITIVLITAAIVFVLDFAFEALNTYGINRLKNAVESSTSEQNTDNVNNSDNNNDETTEDELNNTDVNNETEGSDDSNNVIADNGNETNNTNNNVEE